MTAISLVASVAGRLSTIPWAALWFWSLVAGVLAMWLLVPRSSARGRKLGALAALISLGLLMASLPGLQSLFASVVFWALASVTVGAALAAISMRSPVYAAIWFAISLLATGGLLLFQGAQFLGLATIVVYAGAIVVTFLFVVMLAQPEGQASYDRISWSGFAKPLAVAAAALLVVLTSYSVSSAIRQSGGWIPPPAAGSAAAHDVLTDQHMARFGAELFARHLVSIEVAGTLLLVALVGAIAIVLHDRQETPSSGDSGHA